MLYAHSSPFAAAGSVAGATGTQIAIDLLNEQGGARVGTWSRRSAPTRRARPPSRSPLQASAGFNHARNFLNNVLPPALTKFGGAGPEALRQAALEVDIPDGGTIQGYGVKFFGPGDRMAGQNERATPVIMQYVKGEAKIVYPTAIRMIDPVLPPPPSSPYAMR